MNQLLIVEDDATLAMNLKSFLTNEGFSVNHASRLAEIPQDLSDIDLIVLDWMLPDGQGLDKIKSLRKHNIYTPVVFLTAKSDLIDKVLGLESGANDYLTKPFEVRELLARIRVQLRRPEGLPPINSDFTFGNIRINLERY
jgi:DNA-binding response OmpR family regulator